MLELREFWFVARGLWFMAWLCCAQQPLPLLSCSRSCFRFPVSSAAEVTHVVALTKPPMQVIANELLSLAKVLCLCVCAWACVCLLASK
jgi:hypothetical protein